MLALVSYRPGPHVHVGNLGWLILSIFRSFRQIHLNYKVYAYEAFSALPKSEQFDAWLEDGADDT